VSSGYKGTGGLKAKAGREGPFVVGAMPMLSIQLAAKSLALVSMDRRRLV
jgi:hypothetical protein